MQHTAPKQTKLLGAFVWDLGVITSVSVGLAYCFVFIEDRDGKEHHRFVADLKGSYIIFPKEPQPYTTCNRRISYGLWAEMHDLAPRPIAATTQLPEVA